MSAIAEAEEWRLRAMCDSFSSAELSAWHGVLQRVADELEGAARMADLGGASSRAYDWLTEAQEDYIRDSQAFQARTQRYKANLDAVCDRLGLEILALRARTDLDDGERARLAALRREVAEARTVRV